MKNLASLLAVPLALLATSAFAMSPGPGTPVHHEWVKRTDSPNKVVELFWSEPRVFRQKLPAILYVHGVQDQSRPGAINLVKGGVLDGTTASGVFAAAMSMPGYGQSSGDADFCGRQTQVALRSVLRYLRSRPEIDPRKIAVTGISCGAIGVAMIGDQEAMASMILVSGVYDFEDMYRKWHTPAWTLDPDILSYIESSVASDGGLKSAAEYRSALPNASRFKMPVLLIAGQKDPIVDYHQSVSFAKALQASGYKNELRIDPQGGHMISAEDWVQSAVAFLRTSLKGK